MSTDVFAPIRYASANLNTSQEKVSIIDHLPLIATILFALSSQLLMRWQVNGVGNWPIGLSPKLYLALELLMRPWVLCAMSLTFLSGISWMITLTRLEVSYAYPWLALNFLLVPLIGVLFFGESLSSAKAIGTLLVALGLIILGKGR